MITDQNQGRWRGRGGEDEGRLPLHYKACIQLINKQHFISLFKPSFRTLPEMNMGDRLPTNIVQHTHGHDVTRYHAANPATSPRTTHSSRRPAESPASFFPAHDRPTTMSRMFQSTHQNLPLAIDQAPPPAAIEHLAPSISSLQTDHCVAIQSVCRRVSMDNSTE